MQSARRLISTTATVTGILIASGLVAGPGQAGVMAVSIFEVNNFMVTDTSGTQLAFGTQIGAVSGNNSGDTNANLDGTNAALNGTALVPIVPPGFGAIDLPQACIGTCPPFPENSYGGFGFAPPPTSTYALSDMVLSGTTVDIGPGNSGGVDAHTRADVSIVDGSHVGSSQTNAGTDVNFTFTALADLDALFSLDYLVQLRAFLDTDPGATGSAQASASWNLSLTDLTVDDTILECAPIELNRTRTATVDGTNQSVDASGHLTCPTFTLIADHEYQLGVRHTSQADARLTAARIPEPFTVGLFGAGLLALGWVRRRAS